MHHQRGLVRAACTARNAYNPALALTSALLAADNDPALKRLIWRAPPYQSKASPQRRTLTVLHHAKSSAHAVPGETDGGEQETRREQPQRKGTFAGYEALVGSFGDATQQQQSEIGTRENERSSTLSRDRDRVAKPSDVRSIGNGLYERRRRAEDADLAHARPSTFNTRDKRKARRTDDFGRLDPAETGHAHARSRQHVKDPESTRPDEEADMSKGSILSEVTNDWKATMHRIGEQANILAQKKPHLSSEEHEEMKSRMDYHGAPFPPEQSQLDRKIPFPWTLASEGDAAPTSLKMLNREINLFMQYMQPTPAEIAARQKVRTQAMAFIDKHIGDRMQTSYFGSERTGLFSATSDLDFRIQPRKGPNGQYWKDDDLILKKMRYLLVMMREDPDWMVAVLRKAKYPIINAQHRHTGIDVQIVSSPSTKLQHDATIQYLERIPNLKQLLFVVKYMFGMRGLVDVFNGGTGSYGLLMMLVGSLTRRGAQHIQAEPGTQLLQFLDFYCEHNYRQNGIALAPPSPTTTPQTTLFRKHGPSNIPRAAYIRRAYARSNPIRAGQWSIGQARPFQPYLPCIQDPANPLNDLGRKMNAIKHIVATLQQVREDLRSNMKMAETGQLGEGMSLLEPVVGRCHEVYLERRRRVEEFGLDVLRRRKERRVEGQKKAVDKRKQAKADEAKQREQQRQQPP